MGNSTPESFGSVDEALSEVRRLRSRVALLEEELKALKIASAGRNAQTRAESPPPRPQGSSLAALERFAQQVDAARSGSRQVDWASRRSGSTQRDAARARAEAPEAGEEPVSRQLTEFRTAITRLREERAQASTELRNLVQQHADRFPSTDPSDVEEPAVSDPIVLEPAGEPGPEPQAAPTTEESTVAQAQEEVAPAQPFIPSAPPGHQERSAPAIVYPRRAGGESAVPGTSPAGLLQLGRSATEAAPLRARRRAWLVTAAILFLVGTGAVSVWYAQQSQETQRPDAPSGGSVVLEPAAPPLIEPGPVEPLADPVPTADGVPTDVAPAPNPVNAEPLLDPAAAVDDGLSGRVELITSREVWLRVVVDGTEETAETVAAGRTLSFRGDRDLLVRAGDAGAVRLVLDGEPQGVLGPDGAVMTRTFDLATPRTP